MSKEFRPSKLDEIFGQDHLKPILNNWLADIKSVPQAILFHGPYGNGKTTIARILAEKLVSNPSDINEINAAASRGIDDIREIAESTMFSGLGGNKVYIIDELHQMTQAAQSALLKVIEEPKKGIYFMLCTTDFAKLLDTIRSRCTKLEVRLLDEKTSYEFMDFLHKGLPEDLKGDIFYSSGGHARDIMKSVSVGISNPAVITKNAVDIRSAYDLVVKWLACDAAVTWQDVGNLNMDEQACRSICDYIVDNPTYLGKYFTFNIYGELLRKRADSLSYLITQKQRLTHLLMVKWQ